MENLENRQFVLRVKKNSDLDQVLSNLNGDTFSRDDALEMTGRKHIHYFLKDLSRQTDNLSVELVRGHGELQPLEIRYTDTVGVRSYIEPSAKSTEKTSAVAIPDEEEDLDMRIIYPDAPPMIEPLENFVEPSWYSRMKKMVKSGRHIALHGPPGVGKDTGVLQWAATDSKILVTVGGDAGFRKRDLVGTTQISNGKSFFVVADFAMAVINGWTALISEVNAADPDALLFLNTVLAPPHTINIAGRAYKVHPDFRLFVTMNLGMHGTKPLPPAFIDRFFNVAIAPLNESAMKSRIEAKGYDTLDPWATAMVTTYGKALQDAHDRGQMRYQVTIRRLYDACELIVLGEDADSALAMAVLDSIHSPIERKVAKQILNEIKVDVPIDDPRNGESFSSIKEDTPF